MQTKIPTYLTNIFQNVMWKLCVELGHKIVFKFLAFINLFLWLEKLEFGQKKKSPNLKSKGNLRFGKQNLRFL